MRRCNFDKLVRLLDEELNLDGKLEVLEHLGVCDICYEAFYLLWRDRDETRFALGPSGKRGKAA